ncbi:MAG: hypothetical protein DYG94_02905 [Leptolyngbya sp. PLA3]|nr:MAG: hypothetical protein EDM82_11395 [Cyanobacteria bacterium CYA]MCE7967678.1 hypothetical protein [Leptolyngbya sp. PL-A3]
MARDVLITGLGAVSALGVGKDDLWNALVEGSSGLRSLQRVDPSGLPCRVAGQAVDFSVRDFLPKSYRKATKVMARDIELAVAAASLAVKDAGLTTRADETDTTSMRGNRLGCQIGAGLIAAETEEMSRALAASTDPDGSFSLERWGTETAPDGRVGSGGMNHLPPLWLLKYLPNMLACHVTILHGAEGPSNTITCAEASALLSLGESTRVIQRDDADACFSGGAESKLNYMGLLRMDLAGRLAHNTEPEDGTRVLMPYAENSGGVLGEAGAVLLVEERTHAQKRGVTPYARIAGFGAAQTAGCPLPTGVWEPDEPQIERGLVDAIESALRDAGLDPADMDAIVPMGLGVPVCDRRERMALHAVFGSRLSSIPLITLAPNVGNCSAGQGGLMTAAAALAIRHQTIPARIQRGAPAAGLDAGAAPARRAHLRHVLVCTTALGGQNAALVLSAP